MGNSKTEKLLKLGLIVSLVFHLSLVITSNLLPQITNPQKLNLVEVDFTTPADLQTKKHPDKEDLKQVVDQDDNAVNDETDPKAKFLSKNNQTVKKQTIAKNRGEFVNSKGNQPQQNPNPTKPKLTLSQLFPRVDFAKAYEDKVEKEKNFEREAQKRAESAHERTSEQEFMRDQNPGGAQASQSLDYIKDLEPGMETMLSTREFVYYTFYNRIRNQLSQHWGSKVRERLSDLYRQGRMIASTDDKISKLLITLSKSGQIVRIQIIGNSGYRELDEAAVDAFKAAAPFPNPPSGIVEDDGTIKIRWDFILEA